MSSTPSKSGLAPKAEVCLAYMLAELRKANTTPLAPSQGNVDFRLLNIQPEAGELQPQMKPHLLPLLP